MKTEEQVIIIKHKNIREQIRSLPVNEALQTRILELVVFARSYDLENCYNEFLLTQAFDWIHTREGGDFWLNVHIELEQYKFEKERRP
jgi:hypothetical protein